MVKKTTGLVLGKFLPPHLGHKYLIDTAKNQVDDLYIVVDNIANHIIDVQLRIKWLKQAYPNANITTLKKELPQAPEEAPETFWNQWEAGLKDILPVQIDFVFASETYGKKLAEVLGAEFKMVDIDRKIVPISATQIRGNPFVYWDYILDYAKPFFAKKICIFGAESTGKSTLTKQLAKYYNTSFVEEYARNIIEENKGEIGYEDIIEIAKGHKLAVENNLTTANKLLFIDTDAITTKIWSEELFNKYPPQIDDIINNLEYDLYILLDVDVPWVKDVVRFRPENRKEFFLKCKNELEKYNKNYVIISGDWEQRFAQAITAVDNFL